MGFSFSKAKDHHKKNEQESTSNNKYKLENQQNSNFDISSKEFVSSKKNEAKNTSISEVKIKKKVKKEIIEEKTLKLNNEIDEQKIKEIEKVLKNPKLKVYLSNPINLENGKIGSISKDTLKIYDNKYFYKLYEMKIGNNKISSVIQLDNKDIIVLNSEEEKNIVSIYRLKDKKYFLFQTIIEDRKGYRKTFTFSGHSANLNNYKVEMIKGISHNRFITISNYGFKIYSLNGNNQYSLILFESHLEGIKYIYEIDLNNLIFCTKKDVPEYMYVRGYSLLLIEKIKLIGIKNSQIDEKLKQNNIGIKNEADYPEFKKNIESLQYSYNAKVLYKLTLNLGIIVEYVILKNKYLIIFDNLYIFIIDIIKEIRYKVLIDRIGNVYIDKYIKKWNDNEFIIIKTKTIYLFDLNEIIQNEKTEIELKIIAYSTFPNNMKNLINLYEENRLYIKEEDYILLY